MSLQSDFMLAVNQIAAERNINVDEVLEAIKQAIKSSFRKDYSEEEEEGTNLNVEIDPVTGAITVVADKKVVDDVTNPSTQISLKDAKKIETKLRVGDHVEVDITPQGDFGRVAAQTAKQVILQKIREAEKESVLKEFQDRIGDIETANVQRLDGDSVIWEVRKAVAIMPYIDRVPSEFYRSGSRHKILLKAIENGSRGKQLIVSRADSEFLKALFKLEVPEIVSGSVEIKAIAREAGSRSKVAVMSNTEGIDPIGSCVGQKGVRINAIMNELKMGNSEEKIDIILWDAKAENFIANALSPAEVISVEVKDADEKIARVIVPDEQLSLAIGKEGQNVRLAAKLTGWKIDIQGETVKVDSTMKEIVERANDAATDKSEEAETEEVKTEEKSSSSSDFSMDTIELDEKVKKLLVEGGVDSMDKLKEVAEGTTKIKGVGPKMVEKIKSAI